jgi:hypothetical protein
MSRRGRARRAPVLALLAVLAAATAAWGEAASAAGPAAAAAVPDPLSYIGITLAEASVALGTPAEVFSYRGGEGWQDDVVFFYPSHLYLFWFRNRVWQVRVDAKYVDVFLGLRIGMARDEVISAVGRQYQELPDSLVFFLADASLLVGTDGRSRGAYPLRLRAFFGDGKLSDAYLYRGDF